MAIRLSLFLLFSILFSISSKAQWRQVAGPFGGEVFFLQQYAGAFWAGSESGLYRSPDGLQWARVTTMGNKPVIAGLVDNDTLYIVRDSDYKTDVLTTTDGGQSWRSVRLVNTPPGNRVFMKKAADVLVVAMIYSPILSLYFSSPNNGATFQNSPFSEPEHIDLFDANGAVMAAYYSGNNIWVSIDGGLSALFGRTLPPDYNKANQIVVTDSAIIVRGEASSGAATAQISFDTAQSWQPLPFPIGFDVGLTLQRTGQKGIMAIIPGKYAYTEDYGLHWQVFISPAVPRQLCKMGNHWLISSVNGFYSSPDTGMTWTKASQGFLGYLVHQVHAVGNRLYAVVSNVEYNNTHIYYTEGGNGTWSDVSPPLPIGYPIVGFYNQDTLVAFNQITLDGGSTWTTINYPNASSLVLNNWEFHNGKAYMPNINKIHIVPLHASPTAQSVNTPTNDYYHHMLYIGDTLYVTTETGYIFRQLPNTTNWTALTPPENGYFSKLFYIHGRFFHPRHFKMRYSDDGTNWQTLPTGGIPWSTPHFVNFTDMIGINDSVIVATTYENGPFFSTDRGLNWWPFQSGLPEEAKAGLDLAKSGDHLYAALYRQGIWQRGLQMGTSTGIVYRDDNQNGIQEPGEPLLPNQKVLAVQSNTLVWTDSIGRYQLVFDLPADTVRAVLPVTYGSVQPAYRWAEGIRQNQDFGVWIQSAVTDLGIFATNTAALRPGFDNSLYLSITNAGTTHTGATVGLKLPWGASYVSAEPAPATITGDSLTWHLDSIAFLGTASIAVHIRINTGVVLGQMLDFYAFVAPDTTDYYPADNDFVLHTISVGSYDPNDKQVWPGPMITPEQVAAGEPLHYTIRFQNTGTYLAERVRLVDTLDAHLDLSFLAVVGASHPYTWRILDGHVLEILFNPIQLPDSNSNQAGSHGFFSFSIQAKRNLPLGTLLTNKAYIYFDFNAPIVTNTAVTEIAKVSGVSGPMSSLLTLHVAPNPAATYCRVQLPAVGGALALFDGHGRLVHWLPNCPQQTDIEVRNLPVGVYFLHWQKGGAQANESIIITH